MALEEARSVVSFPWLAIYPLALPEGYTDGTFSDYPRNRACLLILWSLADIRRNAFSTGY
ncbi:hypothetical protein [Microbulbifer spongiae]|uniref:Uncharacterized protein n=1 Tax=Microbulbifer spongiae TaxID=2944933 RepID=A0ABY9ECQ3_9GAMM|nr:hypothetical protein [Microbulbifer sp. MI-G]WKD50057.1 hypothetical protein M8T91_01115 [Microbulbifer sp. MI-G]